MNRKVLAACLAADVVGFFVYRELIEYFIENRLLNHYRLSIELTHLTADNIDER